jgi:hypothetical protein
MSAMSVRDLLRSLAALVAGLSPLAAGLPAWGCAVPTMEVVSGAVRGLLQESGGDATSWSPDHPGAILELQGPDGPLRFRLSRNIGMTLAELRARAADGRPVRVKYETTYEGQLRALQIVGAEQGR